MYTNNSSLPRKQLAYFPYVKKYDFASLENIPFASLLHPNGDIQHTAPARINFIGFHNASLHPVETLRVFFIPNTMYINVLLFQMLDS